MDHSDRRASFAPEIAGGIRASCGLLLCESESESEPESELDSSESHADSSVAFREPATVSRIGRYAWNCTPLTASEH
jgi:hypothetical protein